MTRPWLLVATAGPPLVLAGVGLTHPHLNGSTAAWWTTMHLVLVPLFPLLGVAHWVLLRSTPGVLAWVSRVAAFTYAAFYGALDTISGVGTGTVMVRSGVQTTAERPEVGWLFGIGGQLGTIGATAFLLACVTTSVVLVRRNGWWAVPGAVVLVAASVPFLDAHIYWPAGVLSMVGLAAGFGMLAWQDGARRPSPAPAAAPSAGRASAPRSPAGR